ncbi:ABC transporter substrate-binding protein [Massilia sp. TS11]|uniref:substrate-binding periplasmic protein n=1 Tax=Massilia sp. TS11 TaxID=2908003 RepID=UPI001EDAC5E5|nr:transporter substrate-binding domain-containing protein [Massilia sp. TS11]MCG2586033.1 transporter substrate-binding domain-containing protein [Massilia sp. TS11]
MKRLALLAVLSLWLAVPARAAELLAVGAEFSRVFEKNAAGEYDGMAPAILRELARRMGYSVRFELLPWPRAQAMVADGRADILIGPYKTPEREATFAFSELPFYQDAMVFYSLASHKRVWQGDYAALASQRLVAMNGWAYGPAFEAARPRLDVSTANAVENGLKMLAFGRADLFASNRRNTEPVISRLHWEEKFVVQGPPLYVQQGYFAFPRKPQFDALRRQFDAAMRTYAEAGDLKRLGLMYAVTVPPVKER